jgi:hypothetical protein
MTSRTANILVFLYYLLIFFLLQSFGLSTSYVEGDDARTILYHAAGRQPDVQGIFNWYQIGFDYLLYFLPDNENTLRVAATYISFLFGFLLLFLCYFWVSVFYITKNSERLLIGAILPLLIPDFLFHSLFINPTNIGFTFCMMGLISIEYFQANRKFIYFLAAILLFFIAVPFRWPLLTFLIVPAGLYFFKKRWNFKMKPDYSFFILIMICVISGLAGILLTGIGIMDFVNLTVNFKLTQSPVGNGTFLINFIAANLSFFTPAMVLLCIAGMIMVYRQYGKHIFFIAILIIIPLLILLLQKCYPSFKYLITILPVILLLFVNGIRYIEGSKYRLSLNITLALMLVLPWFAGLKIYNNMFAYGPGFEISNWKNANADKSRWAVKPVLGSGCAMPTAEGPRPVYGYFYCFFTGSWRTLIEASEKERTDLINNMILAKKRYLLQDVNSAFSQCILYRLNYKSYAWFKYTDSLMQKDFIKNNDTISIVVPEYDHSNPIRFYKRRAVDDFYILSSYSSILNPQMSDTSFFRSGPFTGWYKVKH